MAQAAISKKAGVEGEPEKSDACAKATETENDKWLLNNPERLASVKRGLADSAAGRVSKRVSYAEYANDNLED